MAFTITQTQLEQMKNVDIQTVNRDSLVDIQTIQVDTSLPKNERILSFLENIKNPYCFKCGQMVVKVKFDEGSMTLQDRMIHYFQSVG